MATTSAMCRYLEEELLNHAAGVAAFTMPAEIYLCLLTGDPGKAGDLTDEVDSGTTTYERQAVTFGAAAVISDEMTVLNDSPIVFPVTGESWGTITWGLLVDGADNALFRVEFDTPRALTAADMLLELAAGELAIRWPYTPPA